MSLVFAAIAPHTPLLMPAIGKDASALLAKTKAAYAQLERDLYVAQPQVIMVLTPHGMALPDAVCMNLNGKYKADFSEFGDLSTHLEWKSEMLLVDRIREDFKKKDLPLTLCSDGALDYGTAVPLAFLTAQLKDIRVIPFIVSGMDMKSHYAIGKQLKDEIMKTDKRVAVIASADLSHRTGEQSPAGFSPRGVAFDEKILEILTKRNPLGIMDIDEAWSTEAAACGAKVLGMFFGIMDDVHHAAVVHSYEKPFGVGYLTAEMKFR